MNIHARAEVGIIGRFNGEWAIEAFTTDQWATVQGTPRRFPWKADDVRGPWS